MYPSYSGGHRTYGVKFQARSLSAVTGHRSRSRFLIGTLSLREENEIHVVELGDDGFSITCEGLYAHQHEIWDIGSCPHDETLVSTVYSQAGEPHAAIWQLPSASTSSPLLRLAAQLSGPGVTGVQRVVWPAGPAAAAQQRLVTVHDDSLRVWDLQAGAQTSAKQVSRITSGSVQPLWCGTWDPHHADIVATSADSSFSTWDLRTAKKAVSVDGAHFLQIRDLSFNQLDEHLLASCSDDSRVRLWDLRRPRLPLLDFPAHSHWAWRVAFSPFHAPLLLSAGTDLRAHLWRAQPGGAGGKEGDAGRKADLLTSYSDYEESVYGLAWSTVDPWVFASLSYDGRVVVHTVPSRARTHFHPSR